MTMKSKCNRPLHGGVACRLFALALALSASGCGMTGGKMLYFLGYGRGRKIPAQFELPPGKLLILVDDAHELVTWPQAREMLAEQTARELVRHEAVDQVISNRSLLNLRQSDPDFDRRSAQAVGREIGADTVLIMQVREFLASDRIEDTEAAARMSVAIKVIDAREDTSSSRVRLWPTLGDGHLESIEMPATRVHSLKSEKAIAQALTHALGRNVARLFYQHTYGDVEDDEF